MEFLKNNDRFSFLLDGKDFKLYPHTKTQRVEDYEVITVYDFECGLKFTNVAKKHDSFGAYEWVNYLENTGDKNTPVISELWDCCASLPCSHYESIPPSPILPKKEERLYVINPTGSTTKDETDFALCPRRGTPSIYFPAPMRPQRYPYASYEGRSSDGNAPFFNIHDKGRGYMVCIGWTGQWNCRIELESDSVLVRSKIEDTEFYLCPKEKLRTSSVVIMPYVGSVEDSYNIWRRFLRQDFSPIRRKRMEPTPLILGFWGGTPSAEIIKRIDLAVGECGIPFECVSLDAGWCGSDTKATDNEYSGDWAAHVGDWVISPLIHEKGLADVSETIKSCGKGFSLWFEPERVYKAVAHKLPAEYILDNGDKGASSYIFNLGNDAAWQYMADFICGTVERLGLDVYRQDFNIQPLSYWRSADVDGRRGITEIKHIMGLYRLWDTLLEKFPALVIDNCASGGKRLDFETLRRSVPFWRSDAQCPADPVPEITQTHQMNFSLWMPYSGSGSGRIYDTYRMRSAYGTSLSTTYSYSADEHFGDNQEEVCWLKEHCEEYLRIRPYFDGDIYHLTEPQRSLTAWCATQWHRPETGDGMLQVFKREESPYPSASLNMRKINVSATYRFTDLDGESFDVSGKELSENGLILQIPEKRIAKIYLYKEI